MIPHRITHYYILDGNATVNVVGQIKRNACFFDNNDTEINFNFYENTKVLLSGEPIKGSVFTHGPSVMNTHKELRSAVQN